METRMRAQFFFFQLGRMLKQVRANRTSWTTMLCCVRSCVNRMLICGKADYDNGYNRDVFLNHVIFAECRVVVYFS